MLPEKFVTCQRYSRYIGYYRQHLSAMFCKDDIIEKGNFSSVFLHFTYILDLTLTLLLLSS